MGQKTDRIKALEGELQANKQLPPATSGTRLGIELEVTDANRRRDRKDEVHGRPPGAAGRNRSVAGGADRPAHQIDPHRDPGTPTMTRSTSRSIVWRSRGSPNQGARRRAGSPRYGRGP